jgi:hypothetical protein
MTRASSVDPVDLGEAGTWASSVDPVDPGEAGTCNPHSVLSVPAQRPARPSPGWVQHAQPIEA